MAQAFNLTAQLQLQAPNTQQVAQQIQNDLGSININVGIQQNAQALSGINKQLNKTNKAAGQASKSMNFLNKGLAEAARRFSVITVATGSFIALARGIRNSVGAAVEFERELVKISQVTGTSVGSLDSLQKRVTGLSTELGVANATLLQTARVLTQAGLSARKTSQALEVLANTTLAPSFDNIIDTTEGAIAILNQFGRQAAKTGSDIRFLEESLDAINQVSKNFAVESADLISAVRRTGGVFQAAGGNLKELVALFTSVRQTTRESAETIATGFRTIFTRLQRKDTIEALKELGIVLTDVEGKFVGPLKAIEALSTGLAGLDPKDVRFNEIVEQLGGFRQIGKVIPLLKQYAVTQNALAVANRSSGSTAKDAQTAQQSLAQQFAKTREQFDALIRKFAGSDTFQGLAKTVLKLANSFLKFAESLENVLPLLTSIAAIKIGQNLAPGVASLIGGRRKNAGGRILGFNSGGMVPGNGNRDTVPAMLTPGEFVIRKGSVQKLGAENLARMNEGRARYNKGTTGTGAKKSDAKKGAIVKAGGGAQASHIGPAIELSDAELKKFFSDYGGLTGRGNAKFKRSFAQNVAGISTTKIVDGKEVNKSAAELYGAEYKAALEKTISNSASLNQARRSIGLKAQNPTLLNWPSTFNQALRVTDPNLVAKDDLIAATSREKNLVKIGGKAASAKFSSNVPVRSALVSAIKKTPTKKKNERDGRAAFDVDSELDGLKGVLIRAIEAQDEQVAGQLLRDVDFIFKGGKAITSKGKARTSQERFQKKNFTQKALGGLIQKFATGGIVEQGAAGAAILDPVGASSSAVKVSNEDVKKSFSEFSRLPRGKDPVSQFYKPKSFAIAKSGLNQQTSDKFKNILEDGLVAGINDSAAALSRDLGTPSATIAKGETGNFVRAINTSVFGRLYETVIESISNSGKFSGSDPNRPFDAEGGLPSGLKDNFSGLPAKFIDLKSSEEAAGEKGLKGKVVQQIKRELIQDGILNADYPGKAQADKKRSDQEVKTQRERDKKAEKSQGFDATVGRRRGFNKGGGISGKDTVPALLTPGEFVFSKEASQSIGYGNLSKMNTQGVKGYNKGGVVGFKKYANGTGPTGVPSGGGGGIASLDLSGIQAAIATLEATANDYSQSLSDNSAALDRAKAANEDTASLVAEKAQSEATLAAVYNKLGELYDSEEFAKLEIAEAKLIETTKKQDKQLEELIKAEEAAELAARKGAERQPKKERVGPSGPQAKGDSVSIGKGANESLKAIASSGVKLAGVQQLYLKTLQTGVGKNAALNATADAVAKVLEENKTSVQESIQANRELTADSDANGNLTDQEISNRAILNAKLQQQSDASGQVTAILQKYRDNLAAAAANAEADGGSGVAGDSGQGGVQTEALQNAINSVAEEQGILLSDTASLRQAVLQRAVEEKQLAAEEQNLAESIMAANAAAQQAEMALESIGDSAAGGGAGSGAASGAASSAECVNLCKETIDALCACMGGDGSGSGGGPAGTGGAPASQQDKEPPVIKKLNKVGSIFGKIATGAQKLSGAFNAVASAAVGLTFLLGTLIQNFSSASDAQKEQEQAGLAAVNAFIGIGAQVGSLVLQLVATTAAAAAVVLAKGAEALASTGSAGADALETVASGAATGADTVEAGGSLLATGADALETVGSIGATIADTAEAAGSVAAGAADTAEAGASLGVVAALGPFAAAALAAAAALGPLAIAAIALAAALAVVAAAFVGGFLVSIYASAKAAKALEQSVDKFAKRADEELSKAGSAETVGTANEDAFVAAQVGQATADFRKNVVESGQIARATAEGTAKAGDAAGGALVGLAAGAAIGAVTFGLVGAVVGAGVGALVGALVVTGSQVYNFRDGIADAEARIAADIKARAKEEAKIASITTKFAQTTFRATKAVAEFDKALKDAAKVGLDATDTLLLLGNNTQGLIQTFDAGQSKIESANKGLKDLAPQLVEAGLITESGEDVTGQEQALNRAKLDPENAEIGQVLDRFKELQKIAAQAQEAQNKLLSKINAQENQIRQQQIKAIGETIVELGKVGGVGGADSTSVAKDIAGGTSPLDAIAKAAPKVAAALRKSQQQIEVLINKEFAARIKAANEINDNAKVAALQKQQILRLIISQKQLDKAILERTRTEQIAIRTRLIELRAGLQLAEAQRKSNAILGGFNSALLGATKTAEILAGLDNALSLAEGGNVEVGNFDNQIQAIELGTESADLIDDKTFSAAIANGVSAAQVGDKTGTVASFGNQLEAFRDLPTAIESTLRKSDKAAGIEAGEFGKRQTGETDPSAAVDRIFGDIDKNLGGALAGTDLGNAVRAAIEQKILDGKEVTFEDIQDIIDEAGEVAEGQKEVLIRALEIQNEYAQNLAKINNAILAARAKLDDLRGNVEDVRERVAERNASAQGVQRSRNDREQGRRRAATQRLGVTARGAGAIAGDVGATSNALKVLEQNAQNAAKQAEKAGNGLDKAKFADQANKFAEGARRARAELERLADQSARAADVEEDLANLRKQGAQIEDLQEKLAFGSDEQRAQIGEDFKNLNRALAQGGLQGATGEQRQSVGRALDAVSDQVINFEGQDLLGSEVKKIIAARESGRIGAGGTNEFLKKIRAAENPLLAELNDIGKQEIAAAQALAESQERQIDVLVDIRNELKANFDKDIANNTAQNQAESEARTKDDQGQTRGQSIATLDTRIKELDGVIGGLNTQINALDSELAILQDSFRQLGDFINSLDQNETRRKALTDRNQNIRDRDTSKQIDKDLAADTVSIGGATVQRNVRDNKGNVVQNPEFAKIQQANLDAQKLSNASGEAESVKIKVVGQDGKEQTIRVGDTATVTAADGTTQTVREATETGSANRINQGAKVDQIRRTSGGDDANFDTSVGNLQSSIDKNTAVVQAETLKEEKKAEATFQDQNKGDAARLAQGSATGGVTRVEVVRDSSDKEIIGRARGGPVYRNSGGSIFKPRGTDTVPAMLTPGEFVIRKSAVDAVGTDALSAINKGNATVYKKDGGEVKIPTGDDIKNVFLQSAQDPKLLRRALAQGFEGKAITKDGKLEDSDKKSIGKKTGGALFGAILRLSKAGAIAPNDLGNVNNIANSYDNLAALKGVATAITGNGVRSSFALSPVTQNVLKSFSGLTDGAKLTANQKRVANEFVSSQQAEKVAAIKDRLTGDLATVKGKDEPAVKFANELLFGSKLFQKKPIEGYETLVSSKLQRVEKRSTVLDSLAKLFAGVASGVEGEPIVGLAEIRTAVDQAGGLQSQQAAQEDDAKKVAAASTDQKKAKLSNKLKKDFELLQNSGILRMATGGSVGGEDTIPAMLTPGEFVMNPKAVKRYGVGYMRQLNKGNVPGFKRGGLVGGRGVAYRANGSSGPESGGGGPVVLIDPGPLQGILEEFNAAFGARLDNMVEQFSMLKDSISGLTAAISQGMVVQHQFSGDMTLAFSIANGDQLKNGIAEAITPKIQEIITKELDRRLNNNNFKAGG